MQMKRFYQLLIITTLSFSFAALAQRSPKTNEDLKRGSLTTSPPTSEPPLDLKMAVAKAIQNNNAIQQARAKVEQDRYDKAVARGYLLPSISLTGLGGEYKSAVLNSSFVTNGGDPYNQYKADLTLTQPLFAWGSLSALRVADYNTKMNELDIEIAERTLTNNVISAFYKVLFNQRLLEILERIQVVVTESLNTALRRQHTGRGQLLDVLQVKTQIALLKPQIEDAHNQIESAGAQLASYLAEEGKYELQLKGTLKGILLKDIQRKMDSKNARLPELERIRMAREQLSEQKDVIEGKYLPTLTLNGDYAYSSITNGNPFSAYANGWSAYLLLTVPIFEGFQSINQRRSIAAQDTQLNFQGRDLENTLALNQVQNLKTVQSTGASLLSAQEAASLADQSLAEAKRNYRLATIDFLQFLTVQQSTLQADQSLNQIKYNNLVAMANYFVAIGQPLSILIDQLQENNK
jgi:outer membrane protein